MAQEITQGLFGPSIAELRQQQMLQDQQQAAQLAQMDAATKSAYYGDLVGRQIGRGVATAFGAEDPQLKQAADQEQIMKMVQQSGLDMNTYDGAIQAAKMAQQINPQLAMKIGQYAVGLQKQQADLELSQAHAKYYTEGGRSGKAGSVIPQNQAEGLKLESMKKDPKYVLPDGTIDTDAIANDFVAWKNNVKAMGAGQAQAEKEKAKPAKDIPASVRLRIGTITGQEKKLNNSLSNLGTLEKEADTLNLGLIENYTRAGKQWLGSSDKEMQAFNRAQQALLSEANVILQAAKGTQTEGDAQRAYNMIASGSPFKNREALKAAYKELKRIHNDTLGEYKAEREYLQGSTPVQPTSSPSSVKPNAEAWIRAAMSKNPKMTREQVIQYLPQQYK